MHVVDTYFLYVFFCTFTDSSCLPCLSILFIQIRAAHIMVRFVGIGMDVLNSVTNININSNLKFVENVIKEIDQRD